MRARSGGDKRSMRGWRRRAMFGWKRGLIASSATGLDVLAWAEERQAALHHWAGTIAVAPESICDAASNSTAISAPCRPSDNACDLALGMPGPMQLRVQRVSRCKSTVEHSRTAAASCTMCSRVTYSIIARAPPPVANSSHLLLSACDAWPFVQDQMVLCRAFCSSSSCQRS